MLVLSKCSFLWLIYCCQEDSQCCFPMLNKVRIQIKTWGKNNPLDYMGACRTWYCVCGCTWSASVHTISSYAIINLIFLKVCARHIHVEYTQIHTYIVCMYTHMHLAYIHIYISTQRTLPWPQSDGICEYYLFWDLLLASCIHMLYCNIIGKNIN